MEIAKFASDYDPDTILTLIRNDDGDVIIDISGNGEFRIATSGGRVHGKKLTKVVKLFSEIISIFTEEK